MTHGDRLPFLPPYPGPWDGAIAKEPSWRVLQVANASTDPALAWQKFPVSVPSVLVPFRDDDIMGSEAWGGLTIDYSPENPLLLPSLAPVLRGGQRGECFLHSPGEWWIRVRSTTDSAIIPTITNAKLPVLVTPTPSDAYLEWLLFSRTRARTVSAEDKAFGGFRRTKIGSVQEWLGGALALEVRAPDATAVGDMGLVWSTDSAGTGNGAALILLGGQTVRFEGPTFPLCDLWLVSGPPGTVFVQVYY